MLSRPAVTTGLTLLCLVGGMLGAYGVSVLFEDQGWPHGRKAGALVLCLVPVLTDLLFRRQWGTRPGFARYLYPSEGLRLQLIARYSVPLWIVVPVTVIVAAIAAGSSP